jgi:hypothetical protein
MHPMRPPRDTDNLLLLRPALRIQIVFTTKPVK